MPRELSRTGKKVYQVRQVHRRFGLPHPLPGFPFVPGNGQRLPEKWVLARKMSGYPTNQALTDRGNDEPAPLGCLETNEASRTRLWQR